MWNHIKDGRVLPTLAMDQVNKLKIIVGLASHGQIDEQVFGGCVSVRQGIDLMGRSTEIEPPGCWNQVQSSWRPIESAKMKDTVAGEST
jgi:hypothetical protein